MNPLRMLLCGLLAFGNGCALITDSREKDRLDPDGDGVLWPDDCDDTDPGIGAPSQWYNDEDGDGYGLETSVSADCEAPAATVATAGDCDDGAADINPAATERCDDLDNNCDGAVDGPDAADATIWYADADNDGFGDEAESVAACVEPDGFVSDASDCDDVAFEVNPSAMESCNEADDDCDGDVDEDDAEDVLTWYADTDGDGYGDPAVSVVACEEPEGFVADASDCDDTDAALSPESIWYADEDEDGFGDPAVSVVQCEAPLGHVADARDCDDDSATTFAGAAELESASACMADADDDGFGDTSPGAGVLAGADCDDLQAAVNPSATELCVTTFDDDCDGDANEAGVSDGTAFYTDEDADGFGVAPSVLYCTGTGFFTALVATDCDDGNVAVSPVATETCATLYDDDCDGDPNDAGVADGTLYYIDGDLDGYGAGVGVRYCFPTIAYSSTVDTDCADGDALTFPGAAEVESVASCRTDKDGDGYGDDSPASGVTVGGDCDDTSGAVSPAATELCATAVDDDCDGDTNDAGVSDGTTFYADVDVDGFGAGSGLRYCSASGSYTSLVATDCADADGLTFPGAAELESTTDCMSDTDEDGYGDDSPTSGVSAGTDCDDAVLATNPGATEVCNNGLDDNCDGGAPGCGPEGGIEASDLLWSAQGTKIGSYFGSSVSGGFDLNGNGTIDLVVGSPDHNNDQFGAAYIYDGYVEGEMTVSDADIVISGGSSKIKMGSSVRSLGDLDGDGLPDLVVGSDGSIAGNSYGWTFRGPLASFMTYADADLSFYLPATYYGYDIESVGDVDGDGFIDVAFGGRNSGAGPGLEFGGVWVYSQATDGAQSPSDSIAVVMGDADTYGIGQNIIPPCDLSGDGVVDIVLYAHGAPSYSTWIYYGPISGLVAGGSGDAAVARAGTAHVGWTGSCVGDSDQDGYDDLALGENTGDHVYLFLGPIAGAIDPLSYAAATLLTSGSAAATDGIQSAGDMDGDGRSDFAVSDEGVTTSTGVDGVVFIFRHHVVGTVYMSAEADAVVGGGSGTDGFASFGTAQAGDIDDDGFDDLLISGLGSGSGAEAGSAYLLLGGGL